MESLHNAIENLLNEHGRGAHHGLIRGVRPAMATP